MDVADPSSLNLPSATAPTPAATQRTSPRRNPLSPKRSVRDPTKFRRVSPKSSAAAQSKDVHSTTRVPSKSIRTTAAHGRPLVPVTERRSPDDRTPPWGSRDAEADKWDIVPDGGSAGREGRQFTVANVGNNGRIYLRPTIRPAHQRYPQPNFTFPATPPGAGGLGQSAEGSAGPDVANEVTQTQWATTTRRSPPDDFETDLPSPLTFHLNPPTRHRRALSDSTVQDGHGANDSDAGGFKVVISKPGGNGLRPRTAEETEMNLLPHLDVNIPSWRIGVPRFTATGDPLIRGSSYAPSFAQREDAQTPRESVFDRSQKKESLPPLPSLGSRRPSTLRVPPARLSRPTPRRSLAPPSLRSPHPLRATFLSTRAIIEPSMYDDLTFRPACDDRAIVRYAPASGTVTAATPARLVAEITSPSFLDYELISDFFLTFRAFLAPDDLLRMLIARLRWAVARDDATGMIVHVRGFVALRHWVLNYFFDDFVVDYALRIEFCKLLNSLVEDLLQEGDRRTIQLKILNELKKCWRRACSLYWDGDEFDETADPEAPIAPGGAVGDRDSKSIPEFWDHTAVAARTPTRMGGLIPVPEATATTFQESSTRARAAVEAMDDNRPSTPENQQMGMDTDFGPWSPTSLASLDIVSCSFPGKQMRVIHPNTGHPLAAHPVSSSTVNHNGQVAMTPRALMGKRVRPHQQHRRSNSLPETPEEGRAGNLTTSKSEDVLTPLQHGGSLVRGDVLPPGQAFVPVNTMDRTRQTTVFNPEDDSMAEGHGGQTDAMSGHGMRRLIGSVRRALSTRGQTMPAAHGQLLSGDMFGRSATTGTRLPGTAVVPQNYRGADGARPRLRIDLLGAEVAEDFKRAVREDAPAEADEQDASPSPTREFPQFPIMRPSSDAGLTGGSKSIVIVDDTVPTESPRFQPRMSTSNASVEAFADALVVPHGANITPPMTPPTNEREVARRSSHLLNENIGPTIPSEPLPSFTPDMEMQSLPRYSEDEHRHYSPAAPPMGSPRSHRPPPVSAGLIKMHKRNKSSRTRHSFSSTLRHRHGSFSSGVMPQSTTTHSFDATTYSRYSMTGDDSDVPVPGPLRILRRRPGGDLRAATNVDDLDDYVPRRSHSMGSFTGLSDSIRSSMVYGHRRNSTENIDAVVLGEFRGDGDMRDRHQGDHNRRTAVFSVGQLAHSSAPRRELSLCSTHSSKPVMRPSFEAEAKRLAQIPDGEDDGGVESALLKLEGKYDRPGPRLSMDLQEGEESVAAEEDEDEDEEAVEDEDEEDDEDMTSVESDGYEHRRQAETASATRRPVVHGRTVSNSTGTTTSAVLAMPRAAAIRKQAQSFLSDATGESYSSTPLLDGGYTDDERDKRGTKNWRDRSVLKVDDDHQTPAIREAEPGSAGSQHLSFDFIQKSDSMNMIRPGDTAPPSIEDQSFLDSDLSSELSADDDTEAEVPPVTTQGSPPKTRLPAHPLGASDTTPRAGLPSPPHSQGPAALDTPAQMGGEHKRTAMEDLENKPLPPTPEPTPVLLNSGGSPGQGGEPRRTFEPADPVLDSSRKFSVHLPFILAFDSETLAQQFTLIEKDALDEIDWKELVDMDWRNAKNNNFRSWVDFLRNTDAQGVEVVIARFNLVVKWAISEIVLTQHIEERARCIIKFIHVASHCRLHRNFATLAQLTIALSSNEISRLAKTWDLIPPADMRTLRELENLVTPMRNFFNLRAEMESGPDAGCIPFVGIYTHDLLYNAQRPAEIASSPTTSPLVNFERCRIGAGVVKTLLRLLEASARYEFKPIEGITERCLWIGALSDEEIRRHSGNLE